MNDPLLTHGLKISIAERALRALATLVIGLCLTWGGSLWARASFETYRHWADLYLDNPEQTIEAARAHFATLSAEKNLDDWLQVLLFLNRNDWNGPWVGQDRQGLLSKAQKLAEQQQDYDTAIMLAQDQQEALIRKSGGYLKIKENFLKYMSEAETRGALLAKAWLSSSLAYAEYEQGDSGSALTRGKEALEAILKVRKPDDSDVLEIKNTLSVILESLGNRKQTVEIYEDLEAALRKRSLRFSLAIVLCNHGLLLVHGNSEMKRAAALYREALDIAGALKNSYLLTLAHKGVGDVAFNLGEKDEALKHFNLALDMAQKWSDQSVLKANLYLAKAKLLLSMNRWKDALDAAVQSENLATTQDKSTLRTIRYVQAQAYAGLESFQKSYDMQKAAFELLDAIQAEQRDVDLNKLQVQLGLQLQEQKSLALKSENTLQKERIEQDQWIRKVALIILLLCLTLIVLMSFALRKAREVKQGRERMQQVLDNIEEGILTIGEGMKVEASLSPYLYTLLRMEKDSTGHGDIFKHFLEVIDLNADERATLLAVLGMCLGEDQTNWEFNRGHLPLELSLRGEERWLNLHWQALVDGHGITRSILLAVRDITQTRHLQKERDRAQAAIASGERRVQEILKIDAREALSFVREFSQTRTFLMEHLLELSELSQCFRGLHTIKGLSRTLGFKDISLKVHEIEDDIDLATLSLKNPQRVSRNLQQLFALFSDYQNWIQKLYPDGSSNRSIPPRSLHEVVARYIPALQIQLQKAGLNLSSFMVRDRVNCWKPEILEPLGIMLMHGLSNSADHGFILPTKRGQSIQQAPQFEIEAWQDAGLLHIRLQDNGVGLDLNKIRRIALQQGFQPHAGRDLSDVLFQDGVSTSDEVSGTSGRGVGLSAIRQLCENLQGQVSLKPKGQGFGTSLEFQIPESILSVVA